MSIVLEAADAVTNGVVAIKLLTRFGEVQVERFLREAKMSAGLESAHVIEVLDAGVDAGQPYIVMERLVGKDFGRLLADHGAQPADVAVDLLLQACEALSHAHRIGLVHRDIKASNLFVHENGSDTIVKVLDFGISKFRTACPSEHTLTAAGGGILGSPPYMSPEQIRDPRRVDERTDIWSLGVVAYRLLSARFPFEASSTTGTLDAVLERPVMSLRERGVMVPAELDAAMLKCLERRPESRYRSVAELARAIAPFSSPKWRWLADAIGQSLSREQSGSRRRWSVSSRTSPAAAEPNTITIAPASSMRIPAPPSVTHVVRDSQRALGGDDLYSVDVSSGSFLRAVLPPAPPPPPRAWIRTALTVGGIGALIGATLGLLLVSRRPATGASPSDVGATASSVAAVSVTPVAPPIARPQCPDGMALVEGGRFFMGSDDGPPGERPAHRVTMSAFCMDRHEVTSDAYRACSARGDCKRAGTSNRWDGLTPKLAKAFDPVCNGQDGRGNHPINCIDWSLADNFCRAENKRLPTEAEWEFAARGSDGRKYPWGDAEPTPRHLNACGAECAGWFNQRRVPSDGQLFGLSDGWATTAPVGSFPLGASAAGIEDMVGNVWEWVADAYGEYGAGDQVDPKGPAGGTTRVIRGGAWNGAYADWVRPAFRFHMKPETRSHGVGFRCAKSL